MYNVKHKEIKTNSKLQEIRQQHNHNVRSANQFRNTFAQTVKAQSSPLYRGIQTFNSIPQSIVAVDSVAKLNHNLKDYFLGKE